MFPSLAQSLLAIEMFKQVLLLICCFALTVDMRLIYFGDVVANSLMTHMAVWKRRLKDPTKAEAYEWTVELSDVRNCPCYLFIALICDYPSVFPA